MDADFHDWSITELFAPVWLNENICTCAEGVESPKNVFAINLANSPSFGTGGHPSTRAAFEALADLLLNQSTSFFSNEWGSPRLLDLDTGTGLFSILTKHLNPTILTTSVVAPQDEEVLLKNAHANRVTLDEIVSFEEFKSSLFQKYHRGAFDIIITQRGTERAGVPLAQIFPYLANFLHVFGKLIYSGYPGNEHIFTEHIMGEFFEIQSVRAVQNWPVLVGEPLIRQQDKGSV